MEKTIDEYVKEKAELERFITRKINEFFEGYKGVNFDHLSYESIRNTTKGKMMNDKEYTKLLKQYDKNSTKRIVNTIMAFLCCLIFIVILLFIGIEGLK